MRIRQIKPEFWKDARLAELPEAARLFFVGTWQLADDAGMMRWNVPEIGAELYPFSGRVARERHVEKYGAMLAGIGRLHLYECGHAHVPRMAAHQHLAGTTRRVLSIQAEHERCSKAIPATPRDSPQTPASLGFGSDRVVSDGSLDARTREDVDDPNVLTNITDPALRARLLRKEGGAA